MARRRKRKSLGSATPAAAKHEAVGYRMRGDEAGKWFSSASNNFQRIRARGAGRRGTARDNPCSAVEHYTDVVAEATVAATIAGNAGDSALEKKADALRSTATRAQRGAVAACAIRGRR